MLTCRNHISADRLIKAMSLLRNTKKIARNSLEEQNTPTHIHTNAHRKTILKRVSKEKKSVTHFFKTTSVYFKNPSLFMRKIDTLSFWENSNPPFIKGERFPLWEYAILNSSGSLLNNQRKIRQKVFPIVIVIEFHQLKGNRH